MKNLLLTEDGQKNISIMKICVNDVQKLCEFRDIFIQNGYREFYDDSVHYGYEDDYRDFFCDSKNGVHNVMIFKIQLIQPPHFPVTVNSRQGDGGGQRQGGVWGGEGMCGGKFLKH